MHSVPDQLSKLPCVTSLDDVQLTDGLQSKTMKNPIVVACSDMGAHLPYVCSDLSAPVFVCQNLGNCSTDASVLAALTYYSANHLIVYGHTDCQFLQHLLSASHDTEPEWVHNYLKHMRQRCRRVLANNLSRDATSTRRKIAQFYVLNGLKMLLMRPEFSPLACASGATRGGTT
jgi:carbonic anhydrase